MENTIYKLKRTGAVYNLDGILEIVLRGNANNEEISQLVALQQNNIMIGGRKISNYAKAVLCMLKVLPYNGGDKDIDDLINVLIDYKSQVQSEAN